MTTPNKVNPKPYAHQAKALALSKDRLNYAFWMEMGTGKSKVIVDTIHHLWLETKVETVIVIAPKGAYLNWVKELQVHFPFELTPCIWKNGKFLVSPQPVGPRVFLINVEAFSHPTPLKVVEQILKLGKTLVVVDESTRIKTHNATRTKNLIKLGKLATYKRVMSGSPVTRNPLDLYAQCLFLDWRLLGFTSYYTFRNQYAEIVNITAGQRTFPKIVGFKNQIELSRKLEQFSFRVLKKDCLDLPPKVYEKIFVELTPKQQEIYKKFKKEAVLQLGEASTVSAPHVLTHLLRLHQIVCGHVKTDEQNIVDLESNRVQALLEILHDTQGKVIIWANYHQDIHKICKGLEEEFGHDAYVHYFGQTTDSERKVALTKFQDPNDACRFFLGTPATGGLGITLTAAETVIYYSNGYNLEHRLQSEDRAHRIGQTKSVTYIDMVTPGTVDEKILLALHTKQDLAGMILDDLRQGRSIEHLL